MSLTELPEQELDKSLVDEEFRLFAKERIEGLENADLLGQLSEPPTIAALIWENNVAIFHRQMRLTPKLYENWLRRVLELRQNISLALGDSLPE